MHPFIQDPDNIDADHDVDVDADRDEAGILPPPPPPLPPDDLDDNWRRHRQPRVRALPRPVTPTKEQRALHRLTHQPYETWCAHCVKCRGRNLPHRKLTPLPAQDVVPVIAMDLGHLKRADSERKQPFIVVRDAKTRMTFCAPTTGQGQRGSGILRSCC